MFFKKFKFKFKKYLNARKNKWNQKLHRNFFAKKMEIENIHFRLDEKSWLYFILNHSED